MMKMVFYYMLLLKILVKFKIRKRDLGIISSDIERIAKQTRKLDTNCYEEIIKLIEKIEEDD